MPGFILRLSEPTADVAITRSTPRILRAAMLAL